MEYFETEMYQLFEETEDNIILNIDEEIKLYKDLKLISFREFLEAMNKLYIKSESNSNLLTYNNILLENERKKESEQ